MKFAYVNTGDWLAVLYCAALQAPNTKRALEVEKIRATCVWGVHGIMIAGTRETVEAACASFVRDCADPTCTRDPGANLIPLPVPPGVNPNEPSSAILGALIEELERRPAPLKSIYTN
jgi:hypothetical protein